MFPGSRHKVVAVQLGNEQWHCRSIQLPEISLSNAPLTECSLSTTVTIPSNVHLAVSLIPKTAPLPHFSLHYRTWALKSNFAAFPMHYSNQHTNETKGDCSFIKIAARCSSSLLPFTKLQYANYYSQGIVKTTVCTKAALFKEKQGYKTRIAIRVLLLQSNERHPRRVAARVIWYLKG